MLRTSADPRFTAGFRYCRYYGETLLSEHSKIESRAIRAHHSFSQVEHKYHRRVWLSVEHQLKRVHLSPNAWHIRFYLQKTNAANGEVVINYAIIRARRTKTAMSEAALWNSLISFDFVFKGVTQICERQLRAGVGGWVSVFFPARQGIFSRLKKCFLGGRGRLGAPFTPDANPSLFRALLANLKRVTCFRNAG